MPMSNRIVLLRIGSAGLMVNVFTVRLVISVRGVRSKGINKKKNKFEIA